MSDPSKGRIEIVNGVLHLYAEPGEAQTHFSSERIDSVLVPYRLRMAAQSQIRLWRSRPDPNPFPLFHLFRSKRSRKQ